ncbi:serine protease inhibitor Kazal-type 6 [Mustela erminea]|uniref:serine protease inhibitor Kazal-type 6 n=1 Tax=Mustela erminea TaxID=36723 RepID=UPI00138721AC|nr:serine protease inhibitor Kazal-type 6 [Mustela erminea]
MVQFKQAYNRKLIFHTPCPGLFKYSILTFCNSSMTTFDLRNNARNEAWKIDCGEFQDPKVYCTRESNPHCGSDGQTYGNKCTFCKAMVKSGGKINLKHQGKC